jgi:1-acyl-sn-glycerol-3-phosphate acyltransferase
MFESFAAAAATGLARAVTGVRGEWLGCRPEQRPRIYFANHASHGDFVLIWTVLPSRLRRTTVPVAAADYWRKDPFRRFFGEKVFRAVLIERDPLARRQDPIALMCAAIDRGASLILFPEGTRNTTEAPLLSFKAGLFYLAKARPEVELVPVWINNLNRVMPKGEFVPIPLLCTVIFGAPLQLDPGEGKAAFLDRTRATLLSLSARHLR